LPTLPSSERRAKEPWASNLRDVSKRPNLAAKLSGLTTEADHANWTPADLKPYVEHALETFGPDRLLYGSDWPVVEQAGGHKQWLETLTDLLDGLTAEERRDIFSGNARRIYFGAR